MGAQILGEIQTPKNNTEGHFFPFFSFEHIDWTEKATNYVLSQFPVTFLHNFSLSVYSVPALPCHTIHLMMRLHCMTTDQAIRARPFAFLSPRPN